MCTVYMTKMMQTRQMHPKLNRFTSWRIQILPIPCIIKNQNKSNQATTPWTEQEKKKVLNSIQVTNMQTEKIITMSLETNPLYTMFSVHNQWSITRIDRQKGLVLLNIHLYLIYSPHIPPLDRMITYNLWWVDIVQTWCAKIVLFLECMCFVAYNKWNNQFHINLANMVYNFQAYKRSNRNLILRKGKGRCTVHISTKAFYKYSSSMEQKVKRNE